MKSPQSYFGIDEEKVKLRGLTPHTDAMLNGGECEACQ